MIYTILKITCLRRLQVIEYHCNGISNDTIFCCLFLLENSSFFNQEKLTFSKDTFISSCALALAPFPVNNEKTRALSKDPG